MHLQKPYPQKRGGRGSAGGSGVGQPGAPANEDAQRRRGPQASQGGASPKAHHGLRAAPNGLPRTRRLPPSRPPHRLWL